MGWCGFENVCVRRGVERRRNVSVWGGAEGVLETTPSTHSPPPPPPWHTHVLDGKGRGMSSPTKRAGPGEKGSLRCLVERETHKNLRHFGQRPGENPMPRAWPLLCDNVVQEGWGGPRKATQGTPRGASQTTLPNTPTKTYVRSRSAFTMGRVFVARPQVQFGPCPTPAKGHHAQDTPRHPAFCHAKGGWWPWASRAGARWRASCPVRVCWGGGSLDIIVVRLPPLAVASLPSLVQGVQEYMERPRPRGRVWHMGCSFSFPVSVHGPLPWAWQGGLGRADGPWPKVRRQSPRRLGPSEQLGTGCDGTLHCIEVR